MWPARAVQRLESLFDQQMWALGRDVLHPDGNLLARRGLVRVPAPDGAKVSSTWVDAQPHVTFAMSSAGVHVTTHGSTFTFDRGPMAPQLRAAPEPHVKALGEWFASYERWVSQTVGLEWRAAALNARTRAPRIAPEEMEPCWRLLADELGATEANAAPTRAELRVINQ